MADASSPTRHPKPVLGLLGAPGSGKSTVARVFADLGCAVIDADALAHAALQTDAVKARLLQWWGDRVLDADGRIDRRAVGRIVFEAPDELSRLEALVHPIVNAGRQRERERAFAHPDVAAVVEDCPLLLETGLDKQCDALVFVDCPFNTRLERLRASRGWDQAELKRREQRQIPLDTKRRAADYVVSNGKALSPVREQAEHVLQQVKR
ncbi:MAG: dephospho-CoA kinase [Phycisphaeraceae bacterium]